MLGLHTFSKQSPKVESLESFNSQQLEIIERAKSLKLDYKNLLLLTNDGKSVYSYSQMRLILHNLIKHHDITNPNDKDLKEFELDSDLMKRSQKFELKKVFSCQECGYEDSKYVPSFNMTSPIPCPHCKKMVPNVTEEVFGACQMSLVDLTKLYKEINDNHTGTNGKCVRRIVPSIDCKTGLIDSIEIDGIKHLMFSVRNENQHKDLFQWVMTYLKTGECRGAIAL